LTYANSGRQLEIFVDHESIGWGANWQDRIRESIESALVFIPLVTLRYLDRPICREEIELFVDGAEKLGVTDLLLPVVILGHSQITEKSTDPVARIIAARQYKDLKAAVLDGTSSSTWRTSMLDLSESLIAAVDKAEHHLQPATRRKIMPPPPGGNSAGDNRGPGLVEITEPGDTSHTPHAGLPESIDMSFSVNGRAIGFLPSEKGKYLATMQEWRLAFWRVSAGDGGCSEPTEVHPALDPTVADVSPSADGTFLASPMSSKKVCLWHRQSTGEIDIFGHVRTLRHRSPATLSDNATSHVTMSADGSVLAVPSWNGEVAIIEVATGIVRLKLPPPSVAGFVRRHLLAWTRSVCFSPDTTLIATVGIDGLRLFSLMTDEQIGHNPALSGSGVWFDTNSHIWLRDTSPSRRHSGDKQFSLSKVDPMSLSISARLDDAGCHAVSGDGRRVAFVSRNCVFAIDLIDGTRFVGPTLTNLGRYYEYLVPRMDWAGHLVAIVHVSTEPGIGYSPITYQSTVSALNPGRWD
jgi:WD40 repeat protein